MADPLPRPPRRWFRKLAIGTLVSFVGLAVLAWFAPTLIAHSSYKDQLLADAAKDLNGTLRVQTVRLGWLSRVELLGVTLTDVEGKPAVEIERIALERTLWDLVRNAEDIGPIEIVKPTIHLQCEPGKTNLETILAHYLKPSDKPPGKRPALLMNITDGIAKLTEVGTTETQELTGISGAVTIPSDPAADIAVALQLHREPERTLSVHAGIAPSKTSVAGTAVRFPLGKLGPVLRRFAPGLVVAGDVNGFFTFSQADKELTLAGNLLVTNCEVSGTPLRGDRLRLDEVAVAQFGIESKAGVLRTEGIELRCDVGRLFVSGSGTTDDDAEAILGRAGLKLNADLDVAKLAAMLPKLLHLKEGVALTEGKLGLMLESKAAGTETAWLGTVTTTDLRGSHAGKPLTWDKPLAVEFDAKLDQQMRPRFDKLEARSDFFALAGRGKLESFIVMVNLNLDKLNAKLADFVNLKGLSFGGAAEITVKNDLAADGHFQAVGTAKLTNAFLQDAQGRRVAEPSFAINVQAGGHRGETNIVRIDTASATLVGGEDRLSVVLEPIADARSTGTVAGDLKMTGELSRWLGRVRPWVDLPADLIFAARGPIAAKIRLTETGAELREGRAELEQVRMTGYGLYVDEPKLKIEADGTWERKAGTVTLGNLILHGATLVYDSKATTVRTSPVFGIITAGSLTANLNRVQRLLKLQSDPKQTDTINGLGVGSIRIGYDGAGVDVDTDLKIDTLLVGAPADPVWKEPTCRLALRGRYDLVADRLSLAELRTERDGLNLTAAGDVSALTTGQEIKLAGTLGYDLAKLEPQLKTLLGAGIKSSGTGTKPFNFTGRLGDPTSGWNAAAGLSWQQLLAYGFNVGPAELNAGLAKGVLTTNPVEAEFAGGKVRVEPTVDFTKPGMPLTLKQGRIVEKAKLTPAATADAFGFILPVLANSANVDGTFSFDLNEHTIPLSAPKTGIVKGKLLIHEANASASPMLGELIQLLGGNTTSAVLAKEQTVLVRFENGRIHHEGLMLSLGQMSLKMSGSVGLDRTLQMTIDMPVPPALVTKLLGSNPRLKEALLKKRLSVPVGGTLAKPALDGKKLEAGIQALIAGAGKDLLNDAAGDLFKKLLPGAMEKKKP